MDSNKPESITFSEFYEGFKKRQANLRNYLNHVKTLREASAKDPKGLFTTPTSADNDFNYKNPFKPETKTSGSTKPKKERFHKIQFRPNRPAFEVLIVGGGADYDDVENVKVGQANGNVDEEELKDKDKKDAKEAFISGTGTAGGQGWGNGGAPVTSNGKSTRVLGRDRTFYSGRR